MVSDPTGVASWSPTIFPINTESGFFSITPITGLNLVGLGSATWTNPWFYQKIGSEIFVRGTLGPLFSVSVGVFFVRSFDMGPLPFRSTGFPISHNAGGVVNYISTSGGYAGQGTIAAVPTTNNVIIRLTGLTTTGFVAIEEMECVFHYQANQDTP